MDREPIRQDTKPRVLVIAVPVVKLRSGKKKQILPAGFRLKNPVAVELKKRNEIEYNYLIYRLTIACIQRTGGRFFFPGRGCCAGAGDGVNKLCFSKLIDIQQLVKLIFVFYSRTRIKQVILNSIENCPCP